MATPPRTHRGHAPVFLLVVVVALGLMISLSAIRPHRNTVLFGSFQDIAAQPTTGSEQPGPALPCGNNVCESLVKTLQMRDGLQVIEVGGQSYRVRVIGTSDRNTVILEVNGVSQSLARGQSHTFLGTLTVYVVSGERNRSLRSR